MLFQKRHLSMEFNLFGSTDNIISTCTKAYKEIFLKVARPYRKCDYVSNLCLSFIPTPIDVHSTSPRTNGATSSIEGASFDDIDAAAMMCTIQ